MCKCKSISFCTSDDGPLGLTKIVSCSEQLLSFTYTQALATSHAKFVDIADSLAVRHKERLKIAIESCRLDGFKDGLAIQVTTEAITLDKVVL